MLMKKHMSIIGLMLLLVVLTACAPASTPVPTAVPPTPTAIVVPTIVPTEVPTLASTEAPTVAANPDEVTGESLFLISCASCHGQDRAGQDFTVDEQTISVPSIVWAEMNQTYSADPSRGTVEQQLAMTITNGPDETGEALNDMMPRWSSLSQAQLDSLVQFLKTDVVAGEPVLSTAAQNLMGEQLYQAACASCHGSDGKGKTFVMDGNTIETPSLSWADLSSLYSTDPSRGTVEQQIGLSIVKGLDEAGDELPSMMPRWTLLSQAQVDSLIQDIQAMFK